MKKIYFLFILLFLFVLAGCTIKTNSPKDDYVQEEKATESSDFVFAEKDFDFGTIKQSGGKVSHDFSFIYQGESPIKITGAPTSCGCTSAVFSPSDFKKGDSGILTVNFNPNLHEEPLGKFFKSVSLLTDPVLKVIPEIKIWAQINLDLGAQAYELKSSHDEGDENETSSGYKPVTVEKFDDMLQQKDFTLIDVHIPEQEHIIGTDLVIPYNEIENFEDKLPEDKNAKIVLYCRSGSMSRAAAYVLKEHGYTNIYDVIGGKDAYDEFLKMK